MQIKIQRLQCKIYIINIFQQKYKIHAEKLMKSVFNTNPTNKSKKIRRKKKSNQNNYILGYTNRHLYEFAWPHLHVNGNGGYDLQLYKDLWDFKKWARFRINSIDGRFRWDPSYMFYLFDRLIQIQIKNFNRSSKKRSQTKE